MNIAKENICAIHVSVKSTLFDGYCVPERPVFCVGCQVVVCSIGDSDRAEGEGGSRELSSDPLHC